MTDVRLHPTIGVADLGFVEAASLALSDVSRGQGPVTVMSFKCGADSISAPDVRVTNTHPIDVTSAWSGDRVRTDVAVSGKLPTTPWSIDVSLRLRGKVTYRC